MSVLNHAVETGSVETRITRKGHGSAQTVSGSSQPKIGVCTVPPRTPCIKEGRLTEWWRVVNKYQKVEVKVHREVNNRNPRINLRPLGLLSFSEHIAGP